MLFRRRRWCDERHAKATHVNRLQQPQQRARREADICKSNMRRDGMRDGTTETAFVLLFNRIKFANNIRATADNIERFELRADRDHMRQRMSASNANRRVKSNRKNHNKNDHRRNVSTNNKRYQLIMNRLPSDEWAIAQRECEQRLADGDDAPTRIAILLPCLFV